MQLDHQRCTNCFVSSFLIVPSTRKRSTSLRRPPIRACAQEPNRKGADLLAADVERLKSAVKTLRDREPAQLRSALAKNLLERLTQTEGTLQRAAQSVSIARQRITRSIELALLSSDVPGSAASRIRRILGNDTEWRTLSFFSWQRVPLELPPRQGNRLQREQRKRMLQAVKDAAEAPLWQSVAQLGARFAVIVTDFTTSGAKRHSAAVNALKLTQGGVAFAATLTPSMSTKAKEKFKPAREKQREFRSPKQWKLKANLKQNGISKKKLRTARKSVSASSGTGVLKTLDLGTNRIRSVSRKKKKKHLPEKRKKKAVMTVSNPWDLKSYRTRLAFFATNVIGDKVVKQKADASDEARKMWDLSSYRTRFVFVVAGVIGAKALLSAAPLIALVGHAAVIGDARDPRRWKIEVMNTYAARRSNTVKLVDDWLRSRQPRILSALPQARVMPLVKIEKASSLEIEPNSFLEAESREIGVKAPAVLDKPVVGDVLRGVDEVAYFVETRLERAIRRWYAASGEFKDTTWSVLSVFEWQRVRERESVQRDGCARQPPRTEQHSE